MTQIEYIRECKAFAEKIALAKLEVSKAEERVAELEYRYRRFDLDFAAAMTRDQTLVEGEKS